MKKYYLLFIALVLSSKLIAQTCDIGGFNSTNDIFEGSIDQQAPFNFMYEYSCTQQIYTKEELTSMAGKKITDITFRSQPAECWTADEHKVSIKIYIKETEQNEYVKNSNNEFEWISVSENDLVYDGDTIFDFLDPTMIVEDMEISFPLKKAYGYTDKNLMVMIVQESEYSLELGETVPFYCYPSIVTNKPYRCLYFSKDGYSFADPYPEKTNSALKQLPVVMFTYTNSTVSVADERTENMITTENGSLKIRSQGGLVTVYDLTGKKIVSQKIVDNISIIDLDNKGLYLVNLITKEGLYNKKIQIK